MDEIEAMVDEAVRAVSPLGDHLRGWLLDEARKGGYHPDSEWVRGVLKGAIADQCPDLPMTWLDTRLPTRYDGQHDDQGDFHDD